MKQWLSPILISALLINGGLAGCKSSKKPARKPATNVSVAAVVSEGLDLESLPELAQDAENGEDFEEVLNSSGINNIDLNGDNKVDYINVEEYREGRQRGFRLFTNEDGKRVDVANVAITPSAGNADIVVEGNPQYYGDHNRYHRSLPLSSMVMMAWLYNSTRPRYYHRPYYYGYYPKRYRTSFVTSRSMYRNRVRRSEFKRTSRSRPGSRRTSSSRTTSSSRVKTPITKTPTKSLKNVSGKSFKTTTKKRPLSSSTSKSSGFGTSSTRSKPSTSRKSSSFGGSSSRKRSSSFGGSSSRRRSSSFGGSSSRRRSSSSSKRRSRRRGR